MPPILLVTEDGTTMKEADPHAKQPTQKEQKEGAELILRDCEPRSHASWVKKFLLSDARFNKGWEGFNKGNKIAEAFDKAEKEKTDIHLEDADYEILEETLDDPGTDGFGIHPMITSNFSRS